MLNYIFPIFLWKKKKQKQTKGRSKQKAKTKSISAAMIYLGTFRFPSKSRMYSCDHGLLCLHGVDNVPIYNWYILFASVFS